MKIVVVGTRGIPNILGGVETHCEELYPRIASMGHDVTVIRRKCYVHESEPIREYKGVKLVDLYAPRDKRFEAIWHTFAAVVKARMMNPDLVHMHAIGPSLMAPFARLLGLKVVMTNHGPDYNRQKWGRVAKAVLRFSERMGTKYSNRVIVISKAIAKSLSELYGRNDTAVIYNGVNQASPTTNREYLDSLGVAPEQRYVLALGRFVKEKGFHDLIAAYASLPNPAYKLVIAGDSDHPDEYSEALRQQAREQGVVLTGFIKGEKLRQVMSHASLFVLPSYHEGLPIALLEAMSYNLPVIASDIEANSLPQLPADAYFPVGDVSALAKAIDWKMQAPEKVQYDLSEYDWNNIAIATEKVYKETILKK